ncbi:hypothetical protein GFK26_18395 [Variovorax paradoxus]|uniref:Uncharacterized protein n=1 Tax=Variovorax paradoxus TaxID=34073 RepID=A0A5Q0M536_VARPD|nr:hypothetical protein [Variovorax paradoxus]QFZ84599.1 hypothetical protein GFK26_18395 [Variovorax paradoxus]
MTGPVSAAPSWQESTLQWIKENCPQYLGGRGSPAQKLASAFRKASYLLAEAGHDRKLHDAIIASEIGIWDLARHNSFRAWVEAGGYVAPAHIPTPSAKPGKVPPVVIETPYGPELIQLEDSDDEMLGKLTPPAQHTQTLEEAVAEEEMRRDDRYGAW